MTPTPTPTSNTWVSPRRFEFCRDPLNGNYLFALASAADGHGWLTIGYRVTFRETDNEQHVIIESPNGSKLETAYNEHRTYIVTGTGTRIPLDIMLRRAALDQFRTAMVCGPGYGGLRGIS